MMHLVRVVDRHWFARMPAARLAVLRLLLGSYVLFYLGRRYSMFLKVAESDPDLFKPVGVARALEKPLPIWAFRRLLLATYVANVLFIVGWRYRYSGPTFAGLLLWVLSYRNSWSMIYHNDNVLVLHAMILGFTPAADALSVDTLIRLSNLSAAARLSGSWHYGWPIQLMNSVTVLTYFLSGVAKVTGPLGWGWANGEALRSQIAVDGLRKELLGSKAAPLAYSMYNQVGLFKVIGMGSLAMELGAPLALADRRLARLWAVGAFAMHWGIFLIMRIKFRYQLTGLIFAAFFDVERAAHWLSQRTR